MIQKLAGNSHVCFEDCADAAKALERFEGKILISILISFCGEGKLYRFYITEWHCHFIVLNYL